MHVYPLASSRGGWADGLHAYPSTTQGKTGRASTLRSKITLGAAAATNFIGRTSKNNECEDRSLSR